MSARRRGRSGLRVLAAPFVVAPPRGVRVRTRVCLTPGEEAAVVRLGVFLGGRYRATLADRIASGALTARQQAVWRQQSKHALTAATSSRWAGAITRTALDAYALGMRGLDAHVNSLRAAVATLAGRLAAPVGGQARDPDRPASRPVRGYATGAEHFAKSRRKAQLEGRLTDALDRQAWACPRIVAGGGRLWRNRHHLDRAGMTQAQWEQRWTDGRMFLTADGESGKRFGNETIRVDDQGVLTITVPGALTGDLGTHLAITTPVSLATHRGGEWVDRIAANRAVRYDLHRDERGRWYLDASWAYGQVPAVPLDTLQARRTLGVDLNDGHADAAVVDPHGNLVGTPIRLDFALIGTTTHRGAQLCHVLTRLVHLARRHGCASISIENLGFDQARATGRETMGRGKCGKRFRRAVAGIPTGRFRTRLVGMATTAGLAVVAVDPAYTSRWAAQHWLAPLQSSDPGVDGHRAAALVIGRRGLGHRARRKPVGPPARQRTRRGPSTRPVTRCPQASGRCVTGGPRARDAAGPPDPWNTSRRRHHRSDGNEPQRGTPTDSLPLTQQERSITQEPRRGVTVRQMSRADLEELIEVRTALEVLAVRLCAQRATAAEVARLEDLVAQADAALQAGDGDALRRCTMAFHDALVAYAHNDLLATMFEPIQGRMHWLPHQNDGSLAVHRGHAELARAIGAHDTEAAAASLEHVRTSRGLSLRLLFPEASAD